MSDTDATLTALRERAEALLLDIADARLELRVLEAQHAELLAVIEIITRGGRRKPGPKPGSTRLVVPPPIPDPEPLGATA